MGKLRVLIASVFVLALLFVAAPTVLGSEGVVEMRSTTGQNSRCFVSSTLMTDFNYAIVANCRDLIYPPASDLFAYILWSNPIQGGKPVKIGSLGFGKNEFRTQAAFSSLFVTKERNDGVGSPSTLITMQGEVQTINFLEKPGGAVAPSPTPTGKPKTQAEKPKAATKGGELIGGLQRVVLFFVLSLFGLIILSLAIYSTFKRLRS